MNSASAASGIEDNAILHLDIRDAEPHQSEREERSRPLHERRLLKNSQCYWPAFSAVSRGVTPAEFNNRNAKGHGDRSGRTNAKHVEGQAQQPPEVGKHGEKHTVPAGPAGAAYLPLL